MKLGKITNITSGGYLTRHAFRRNFIQQHIKEELKIKEVVRRASNQAKVETPKDPYSIEGTPIPDPPKRETYTAKFLGAFAVVWTFYMFRVVGPQFFAHKKDFQYPAGDSTCSSDDWSDTEDDEDIEAALEFYLSNSHPDVKDPDVTFTRSVKETAEKVRKTVDKITAPLK